MLRINQIKLPIGHAPDALEGQIRKILRLRPDASVTFEIVKKSIDARKKPDLFYVYSVRVKTEREDGIVKRLHNPSVLVERENCYRFPEPGERRLEKRPVIVGAGPAGLFAAYQLAQAGFAPILLERGAPVEERREDVASFWRTGVIKPESNVQFGEGGAGTFSDGKLNTAVKDPSGRNAYVLRTFVKFGAPESILYENKPHIGTDVLAKVTSNFREYLKGMGVTFSFHTQMTELVIEGEVCTGVRVRTDKNFLEPGRTPESILFSDVVILAPGHSARDTFFMLRDRGIPMEAKNFAVGFRVEHPQKMIDTAMYGAGGRQGDLLPAAPYKVTSNFPNGRGVYSFCMCPGGFVVNAASEPDGVCVNGMSYSNRLGENANSAIIVSVTPKDFGSGVLDGVRYQQRLERESYALGAGKIPQQLFGDYVQNVKSSDYGAFASQTKGASVFANLRGLMSADMENSFMDGMAHFSKIIKAFDRKDAILSGMETRTSSPVRILRDEHCKSAIKGIYPCGEGAGYAGGIMSAAIDGLKVATSVMEEYRPAY